MRNATGGIYKILEERSALTPHATFLVFKDKKYSYESFKATSDLVSINLYERGLRKGDKVGLILNNCPEFTFLYFALAKIGAVLVPLNPKLPVEFIQEVLGNQQISFLVTCDSWANCQAVDMRRKDDTPFIQHTFIVGAHSDNVFSFDDLLTPNTNTSPVHGSEEDYFSIIFTSGSTGKPKGVVHTQKNIILNGQAVIDRLKLNSNDIFLFPFPLTSIFGMGWTTIALLASSKIVLMDFYDHLEAFRLIEKYHVTIHSGNSAIFLTEINSSNLSQYDTSSLRLGIIGGQVVGKDLLQSIKSSLGMKVSYCYGMTEAAGAISLVGPEADREEWLETAGKPLEMVDIKILDIRKNRVKGGKVGDIYCKAEFLAKTYFIGSKEVPVENIDGWFCTGDVGYLNSEGCLCVVGRKGESINLNGKIYFTQDVEKTLSAHPSIMNCAMLQKNNRLQAIVEPMPNTDLNKKMVHQCLSKHFECDDIAFEIQITEEIPLTATGKIDKVKLAKNYAFAIG